MSERPDLTSGRLLARNVGMNLAGWALPAVAAIVAVPFIVHGLGDARFGVLALAWTALGYFSLFDAAIGRALTHAVADRLGRGRGEEIAGATWTALALLVPVGVLLGGVVFALAPWLANTLLHVPPELREETALAFRVLAFAVPFTGAAALLRGVLEAKQRFDVVTLLRVPYGLLTFLGPLAALPFSRSLVPAVAILTVGRAVLCAAHFVACARTVPGFLTVRVDRADVRALASFGGWLTLANVVSSAMNTLDRFVVGALLSVSLVTYYVTPHELVTKMWLFTAAIHPVFFPAFTTSAAKDTGRTVALFDRVLRLTLAGLFVPTLLLAALAPEILRLWVGGAFVAQSTGTMRVLAIAVYVNTIGQGALILVQSLRRPDLTGKYYLVELPLYAGLLWYLLPRYGIFGVAVAWAVRATLDAALLLWTCPVLLPESAPVVRRISVGLALATAAIAAIALTPATTMRAALTLAAIPAWIFITWRFLLTPDERRLPASALGIGQSGTGR